MIFVKKNIQKRNQRKFLGVILIIFSSLLIGQEFKSFSSQIIVEMPNPESNSISENKVLNINPNFPFESFFEGNDSDGTPEHPFRFHHLINTNLIFFSDNWTYYFDLKFPSILVENCDFTGAYESEIGVSIENWHHIDFVNCTFSGNYVGIKISSQSTEINVINSSFSHNYYGIIGNSKIQNCSFINNSKYGAKCSTSGQTIISYSNIYINNSIALSVAQSSIIHDNIFSNNNIGLVLDGIYNSIKNNYFDNSKNIEINSQSKYKDIWENNTFILTQAHLSRFEYLCLRMNGTPIQLIFLTIGGFYLLYIHIRKKRSEKN